MGTRLTLGQSVSIPLATVTVHITHTRPISSPLEYMKLSLSVEMAKLGLPVAIFPTRRRPFCYRQEWG